MTLRRRLPALLAAAVAAALAATALAAPASAAKPQVPQRAYYLALGDSLGYGYQDAVIAAQAARGGIDAKAFPGYVERVAAALSVGGPRITTVNYSCPGETTTSIRSACRFAAVNRPQALHDKYTGSQLDAALRFLKGRAGQTGLISLSLGSNDLNAALRACQQTPPIIACLSERVPPLVQQVTVSLALMLQQLRAAAPQAEIVVFNIYNPSAFVLPTGSNQLLQAVNAVIAMTVLANDAHVADAFGAINGPGDEEACFVLTPFCITSPNDIHPTDRGYAALAQAMLAALR